MMDFLWMSAALAFFLGSIIIVRRMLPTAEC